MSFGVAAAVGGAVVGGIISSSGAQSAANTQADAANQATASTRAMYDQTRSDLAPYRGLGSSAINLLLPAMGYRQATGASPAETRDQIYARLLPQYTNSGSAGGQLSTPGALGFSGAPFSGQVVYQGGVPGYMMNLGGDQQQWQPLQGGGSSVDYSGLNAATDAELARQQSSGGSWEADPNSILNQQFTAPTAAEAAATPGYQFTLGQGLKAAQNSASARGLGASGAALKGAETYATGLADSTYNDTFNRNLSTFKTNYSSAADNVNRLLGVAGLGENAAAQTGSAGTAAANSMAGTITGAGNASAAGTVASSNALGGALNSAGSSLLLNQLLGNGSSTSMYGSRGPFTSSQFSNPAGW